MYWRTLIGPAIFGHILRIAKEKAYEDARGRHTGSIRVAHDLPSILRVAQSISQAAPYPLMVSILTVVWVIDALCAISAVDRITGVGIYLVSWARWSRVIRPTGFVSFSQRAN